MVCAALYNLAEPGYKHVHFTLLLETVACCLFYVGIVEISYASLSRTHSLIVMLSYVLMTGREFKYANLSSPMRPAYMPF